MPKAAARPLPMDPTLSSLFTVHESVLANGLRVRIVPNSQAPVVSLYMFYRVGSRNERPGITGISHLFEHMMFNGAKKYGPKEFDRVLESSGGRSNAYTSNDFTVYHEDFAAESLETVLDLESDRMRSLAISDKSLASERQVVKEERRVVIDNDIGGMMGEELESLVFKAHAYRWPVIGWMPDIDNISRKDCEEYFRTYYAPNNAVMYLVGDLDAAKTLKLVKRYFGDIRKGPAAPPVIDPEPEQKGERRAVVRHPAQSPALMIGYRGPAGKDPDTLVLDVIQYVLTVGEGSRLNRSLVYDAKIAVAAMVDWTWRIDPGTFLVFVDLKPDGKVEVAEKLILKELEKVAEEGFTDRELQKAKNNLRAHLLRELATNAGRAHALGQYESFFGDWREGLRLPAAYEAIGNEQIQRVAKKYLSAHRRNVVTLAPQKEEGGADALH